MFSRTKRDHPIDQNIQYLKTVGPKRAATLKRLGIETVHDLLYYFPRDYEDRSQVKTAFETVHGEKATLIGTVTGVRETKPRPRTDSRARRTTSRSVLARLTKFLYPSAKAKTLALVSPSNRSQALLRGKASSFNSFLPLLSLHPHSLKSIT